MRWFAKRLLAWHDDQEPRLYPWIGEKDPYKILLSEFLLQQTRSDQALAYYNRFLETYPTLATFATATEDEILQLWSGLGYYARGRNLLKCIKTIQSDHNGSVPTDRAQLLALPGIGPYTSAAIASFAYNQRYPVVDGNVTRLLSRMFRITEAINSSPGKKIFDEIAEKLMTENRPADYNQAIMNYGATMCTPRNASCDSCVFQDKCEAYSAGIQYELPIKKKLGKRKNRFFLFFVIRRKKALAMHKRDGKDIWQGLFVPPFKEVDESAFKDLKLLRKNLHSEGYAITVDQLKEGPVFKQTLTHQIVHSRFIEVESEINPSVWPKSTKFVSEKKLESLAMPRTVRWYFDQ